MTVVVPYNSEQRKKEQIRLMFDNISSHYDLLNQLLSLGIHRYWRRKLLESLKGRKYETVLDVATGTGDMIFYLVRLNPKQIYGLDISKKMLEIAQKKINFKLKDYVDKIRLVHEDCEQMSFPDNKFDLVTCVFGVRNSEDINKCISEIHRVLKPGGLAAIMEFSKPKKTLLSGIFNFYFHNFLPWIGGLISTDKRAYEYLPNSVDHFPSGKDFTQLVQKHGFKLFKLIPLSFGVTTIYLFEKIN